MPLEKSAGLLDGKTVQACPSCGLQARDDVMTEHFLESPTHRNGKIADTLDSEDQWGRPVEKGDSADLALLRITMGRLAAPRAFGLRGRLFLRPRFLRNLSVNGVFA